MDTDNENSQDTSRQELPLLASGDRPDTAQAAADKPAARLRTLSNGAVYDEDQHKIVKMLPEQNPWKITKETSQLMHEKRREQTRKRILAGLRDGLDVGNWGEAVQVMASAQAKLAADPAKGRAATYAFRTILESASLWPEKQGTELPPDSILVNVGDHIAGLLADLAYRRGE
jgi:hypothetical protein